MSEGFPKYSQAARKGDKGVDLVSRVINEEYGWLFKRNHQEHDFGIDAQVDVVLEDGSVTGQMLAMQIKYGKSFFTEKNQWGYAFRGEQKHFNYLANYPIPVLIVICHPKTGDCYWVEFDPAATSKAGQNWKITIPFHNKLIDSQQRIEALLSPSSDYLSEVEEYWAINDVIVESQPILLVIDREDVEELDVSDVRAFFDRIRATRELAAHCQGKIELLFHGYDDDPRELYEIPEVRRFASLLSEALPELFFFVYTDERGQGLKILAMCLTDVNKLSDASGVNNKVQVEFSTYGVATFFESHCLGLNEMTDWLQMPIEENKRITFNVIRALGFDPPLDDA